MTDYIQDLHDALREAAAREYPAVQVHHRASARARARWYECVIPRHSRDGACERRQRRTLRFAALGCAVVAAVFVIANLASTGNRSAVAPAQAQALLRHVRDSLVFPSHAIYEEKAVTTVTAHNGARHTSGSQEWLSTSHPYNGRIIESANGTILWEQAFVQRRLDLYDRSTNTVYLAPRVARHQVPDTPQATSALSEVEYLLKQSDVKINPHARLNGKPALELTFDHGRFSYWMSPHTYQPLQSEDRQDSLPDGQRGVGITRYPIVQVLTGTAASPRLLSLTAQHPTAHIDHSAADYKAARHRLIDVKGALL